MFSEFYQEEELKGSLSSFEQSLEHNETKYFEVHEFEFIIDHYLSSNNISNSKKAIKKALSIHPNNQELQKRLAQVYNIEGLFSQAIKVLDNSFRSFGVAKDLDYYLIQGEAFLGIHKPKKAKIAFKQAIDLSGEEYFDIVTTIASLYQQEGYYEQVIHHLKRIEKDDSSLLFDIGLAYFNIFDFENSIKYFESFIPTAPFSVDAWYYISKSYQAIANYEMAEEALLNTIALDPELIVYQYDLAKLHIDQEKYLEALELYKEILSQDKDVNHTIFLSIGDISYNLEQYDNAQKNYEIALRLNPESSDAYHSLGQVYIETENYEKAKKNIQKAISINSERADFFVSLGTVNQLQGDLLGAEFSFVEATRIKPTLETAWNLLIDFYFFSERPKISIKTAFEAIENIGEQSDILCKIAASYFDSNLRENGLSFLEKALEQDKEIANFFIEYYPEGESDTEIMNKIKLFQ